MFDLPDGSEPIAENVLQVLAKYQRGRGGWAESKSERPASLLAVPAPNLPEQNRPPNYRANKLKMLFESQFKNRFGPSAKLLESEVVEVSGLSGLRTRFVLAPTELPFEAEKVVYQFPLKDSTLNIQVILYEGNDSYSIEELDEFLRTVRWEN